MNLKKISKIAAIALVFAGSMSTKIPTVNAQTDPITSAYGFTIVSDMFDVKWKSREVMSVRKKSTASSNNTQTIGTVTTVVGIASYKGSTNNTPYENIDVILVENTMTPKKASYYKKYWFFGERTKTWTEYGMSEDLIVKSNLGNIDLMAYSPKTTYKQSEYTVGINMGYSTSNGGSVGISASESFTLGAIIL